MRCAVCGGVKVAPGEVYVGDSTVCHCAALCADHYQEIIDRLERIGANVSGLLLIQSGQSTIKETLDWLLLSTVSDDPDIREWAQKYLHEYAALRRRQQERRDATR